MEKIDISTVTHGLVCFTFDDRNFEGWINALPIFAKHNSHASFFVSGEIDSVAIEAMKRLSDAGHTVGLHTVRHLNAPEYFDSHGGDAYFENEIKPQLEACRLAGIEVHSLAYPNNRRDERTDFLLLPHFGRFRAGARDCEELAYIPSDQLSKQCVMRGFGLGEYYSTVESEFLARIGRAADENSCVTFFSHNIAPEAKHINLPTELLESALTYCASRGVKAVGFDELPEFEG